MGNVLDGSVNIDASLMTKEEDAIAAELDAAQAKLRQATAEGAANQAEIEAVEQEVASSREKLQDIIAQLEAIGKDDATTELRRQFVVSALKLRSTRHRFEQCEAAATKAREAGEACGSELAKCKAELATCTTAA